MKTDTTRSSRRLLAATCAAVAMAGVLAAAPAASASPQRGGEVSPAATCADSRSPADATGTETLASTSNPFGNVQLRGGTIAGGTYRWGRATQYQSGSHYVIMEVDKNNNGTADCYLRRQLSNVNYTNALQRTSNWRFRACYAVLSSTTSCAGLTSTTAWVS